MSGDLRFHSADAFLQGRGFASLRDITNISCSIPDFVGSAPGWDFLDGVDDLCAADALVEWISNAGESPFFATLWTNMTHTPYFVVGEEEDYQVGNEHVNRYLNGLNRRGDAAIGRIVERLLNEHLNRYLNALKRSDAAIGRIVEHLRATGLLESTLVVILGDHGEAFGQHGRMVHGRTIYEEEIHIPLILMNPLLFADERSEVLGGMVDVAPTIMDVMQMSAPAGWQGRSLFAEDRSERVYLFCPYQDVYVGYREGEMKYIFNATRDEIEVYDLSVDPGETMNLYAQMPEVEKVVKERLAAWFQYQQQLFETLSD
jgi:arylsulfatase A-like enzyme